MFEIAKTVKKGDYLYAVVKDHPFATKNGYVLHHRVVMENHIGRLLCRNEIVHHKNGDKKDNRIENLELMTASEHAKLHGSDKVRATTELTCLCCDRAFIRFSNLVHKNNKSGHFCSRRCNGIYHSQRF